MSDDLRDPDDDERFCQQCGRPIHWTETLCEGCKYPDQEGEATPLDALPGNAVVRVGPIGIGAIHPDARELLDRIMAAWHPHEEAVIRENGPHYPGPTPYGAFYWLVRWSGLIDPTAALARLDSVARNGREEGVTS